MKNLSITKGKITIYNYESFKTYMREVNETPLMTPDEEFKVGIEAKKGDKKALDYLVKANLRFVISVAKQYVDNRHGIEDLVNEGNIGLIIAAERFDPTKGFKFISYAVWWVRRTIQEYKHGCGEFIKKPSNRVAALNKYREIKNILEKRLEREPSKEEIFDAIEGLEDNDIFSDLLNQEVCSLDKPIGEDGFSLIDTIANSCDVKIKNDEDDIKHKTYNLLSKLKPRERQVLELSFGLHDRKPMTLQEIGDILDLTREGVRQIKTKALLKLRGSVKRKKITLNNI